MIHDKLKKIIFNKLYKDLSHVEIIPYEDSIWFIDRENKYWYFEYQRPDILWWRFGYFNDFFTLFSLEREEFQWVLSEWVEEVLNCKVNTTATHAPSSIPKVEEVLNFKVTKPNFASTNLLNLVDNVLDCRVNKTF